MNRQLIKYALAGCFCCLVLTASQVVLAREYAYLESCRAGDDAAIKHQVINIKDKNGREIKVWLGIPEVDGSAPFLVFSHGAFSSPERYQALLKPFVRAGYIVVAPWHIDSEDVVKTAALTRKQNWNARRKDIAALLQMPSPLQSHLKSNAVQIDRDAIGLFGHSYGAFTAQVFAGAQAVDYVDGVKRTQYNPSVRAVLGYSPPGPMAPFIDRDAWQQLAVPSMVITGSADVLPGFIDDWELHLTAYESAPRGNNWAFIGANVDHYFGKRIGRLDVPDPNQGAAFSASVIFSVAFMDAYLRADRNALACLRASTKSTDTNAMFQIRNR